MYGVRDATAEASRLQAAAVAAAAAAGGAAGGAAGPMFIEGGEPDDPFDAGLDINPLQGWGGPDAGAANLLAAGGIAPAAGDHGVAAAAAGAAAQQNIAAVGAWGAGAAAAVADPPDEDDHLPGAAPYPAMASFDRDYV